MKTLFFFILFLVCISCTKNEMIVGKQLKFTDSLFCFDGHSYKQMKEENFKIDKFGIVCLINSDCGSCLDNINRWKGFQDTLKSRGVKLFFILKIQDSIYFRKFIYPNILLKTTPIIDMNSYVDSANIFFNYFETVGPKVILTDSKKKVKLFGNPTINATTKSLYLKYIEKNDY